MKKLLLLLPLLLTSCSKNLKCLYYNVYWKVENGVYYVSHTNYWRDNQGNWHEEFDKEWYIDDDHFHYARKKVSHREHSNEFYEYDNKTYLLVEYENEY